MSVQALPERTLLHCLWMQMVGALYWAFPSIIPITVLYKERPLHSHDFVFYAIWLVFFYFFYVRVHFFSDEKRQAKSRAEFLDMVPVLGLFRWFARPAWLLRQYEETQQEVAEREMREILNEEDPAEIVSALVERWDMLGLLLQYDLLKLTLWRVARILECQLSETKKQESLYLAAQAVAQYGWPVSWTSIGNWCSLEEAQNHCVELMRENNDNRLFSEINKINRQLRLVVIALDGIPEELRRDAIPETKKAIDEVLQYICTHFGITK